VIKKILILLSILFISLPLLSQTYSDNDRIILRYDRMLHFSFGYMTAMPLKIWTDKWLVSRGYEKGDYGIISLGLPITIGYFKEVYDHNTCDFTGWRQKNYDKNDAYYDFFAVVLGAVCGRYMTYTF